MEFSGSSDANEQINEIDETVDIKDGEVEMEFSGSSDANSIETNAVDNADSEIELEFSGSSDANSNNNGKIDLEFSGSSDANSTTAADGSEIPSNIKNLELANVNSILDKPFDSNIYMKITTPNYLLKRHQDIVLVDTIWDSGASINIYDGPVKHPKFTRGTISGWNRSTISTRLEIGERGLLKQVLSYKGGKDIIVPAHARNILKGTQTWYCPEGYDTHFLVLQPLVRPEVVGTISATIIAVWSKLTGSVERCTEALMKLLDIDQYSVSGGVYELRPEGDGILINATQHGNAIDTSFNYLIESNHSKYDNRSDSNPVTSIIYIMGGIALSSFSKILKARTLEGLSWVTSKQIQDESRRNNHSVLRSSFEDARSPASQLRQVFGVEEIKVGEVLIIDEVFWKFQSGTAKVNFKTKEGYTSALLGVDFTSTRPIAVPLKGRSSGKGAAGPEFKKQLRKLIQIQISDIQRGAGANTLKYLLMDQHKCQHASNIADILEEFDLEPIYARIGSEDMSRLNKTSDTIFKMAHFWILWASMSIEWYWKSFQHALLVYPFIPKATVSRIRGRGFSPFSQWTLIPSNINYLPPPWGCSIVVSPRVKSTRGGIDGIFVGFDMAGKNILVFNPLAGMTPLRRAHGIFIIIKPPATRLMSIHAGISVFDESKLLLGKSVFNAFVPGKVVYFKDKSNPSAVTYNCWVGYDASSHAGGISNKKPLICTGCRCRYATWSALRTHITTKIKNDAVTAKNTVLTVQFTHPSIKDMKRKPSAVQKRVDKTNAILQKRATYDEAIMKGFEENYEKADSYSPFFAFGGFIPEAPGNPNDGPAQNKVESAQSVRSGGNDTTCNVPTVNSEGAKDVIESNTKSHGDTSNTSISNDYDHEKETTTDNSVSKAGGETKDTVSSKSPSIATDLDLDKMNKKKRENRTLRGYSGKDKIVSVDEPITPMNLIPSTTPTVSKTTQKGSKKSRRKKKKTSKYANLPKRQKSKRIASLNTISYVSCKQVRDWEYNVTKLVHKFYGISNLEMNLFGYDHFEDQNNKDGESKNIQINTMNIELTPESESIDVTSSRANSSYEIIKDEIRDICAASMILSDRIDETFQVNHTSFIPTAEFWRTNLDQDLHGIEQLKNDSPYGHEIIGNTTFNTGEYKNYAPSAIPSFLPVSIATMLMEVDPTWSTAITASKYAGEDFINFTEPECELNECEVHLSPGVVTGLKYMDSVETQSYLKQLSGANRKSFIPNNSNAAFKSPFAPFFIQAMMKELASISKLGVVDSFQKMPKGRKAIPCRFIFDIKWDAATDKLVKFKARLVAQGFRQREYNKMLGIGSYDPNDISSPVLKLTSLYSITNMAASLPNMVLITADVGTAFLSATLRTDGSEEIYIQLPPGCMVSKDGIEVRPEIKQQSNKSPRSVAKLIKALYGLRGSSKSWFRKISDYLCKTDNFTQSEEDMCLFTKNTKQGSIMLGIHVDDMLITGTKSLVDKFKIDLENYFVAIGSKITSEDASCDEGVQFLGSVIKLHKTGIVTMSQEQRIEDVCERFKITTRPNGPSLPFVPGETVKAWQRFESMPSTPEEKDSHFKKIKEAFNPENFKSYNDVIRNYREYTGCLIWLCGAGCPQVLPVVYKLARYQNNPGFLHFQAVRRVLEYLYANKNRPLTFGKQRIQELDEHQIQQHAITIFCDTSHGDCPITKRSTGGYTVFLFGSLLMIRSYRLSCVTTSTTQSEYYMMSAAAAESIYLMQLYNNTLLPFINNILGTYHTSITKVPLRASKLSQVSLIASKLSLESIQALNAKVHPAVSETNPIPILGDNSSANLIAMQGPKKNSKHSMIHASWLWDLIHQRKTFTVRKINTKLNPADITTKQDGMGADLFETHTKSLLGELEVLPTQINNVVAHIMDVKGKPMVISLLRHSSGQTFGLIHNK